MLEECDAPATPVGCCDADVEDEELVNDSPDPTSDVDEEEVDDDVVVNGRASLLRVGAGVKMR